MNLETLLDLVPKIKKTRDGNISLVIRWSITENQWIVGYGVQNTIKNRENCGKDKTLLKALIDLNNK